MNKPSQIIIGLILLISIFNSCNKSKQTKSEKLHIVCTTGMIADLVENITNDKIKVTSLMGPGVDPHLYKASHGDLSLLREADLIFYNGLHLEGKMQEVLEKLSQSKPVFAISNTLNLEELKRVDDKSETIDPHIWFDVSLWNKTTLFVLDKIIKLDNGNAAFYKENENKYSNRLIELHKWVEVEISEIPKSNRVLITSHDAFGYFGRAYFMEVKGLQGISTTTEFGLKDVNDMVNTIVQNDIKAVFVESTISERSLTAVVEGCHNKNHNLIIGGTLYSDAMGNKDTEEGNYIGMVKHNVNTIVGALK